MVGVGLAVHVAVAVAGTDVAVGVDVGVLVGRGVGVTVDVAVPAGAVVAVGVGVGVCVGETVGVAVGHPVLPQSDKPFKLQPGGSSAKAHDPYSQILHGMREVFVGVTVAVLVCAVASLEKIAEATKNKLAISARLARKREGEVWFLFFAEF